MVFHKWVCVAALAASWCSAPAWSAENGVSRETEGRIKINVAGRQRMLSQRMSSAACLAMSGIDAGLRNEVGYAAHNDFDRALAGLRDGDAELGLTQETNEAVRDALTGVSDVWQTFSPAVQSMIAGDLNSEVLFLVFSLNTELLTISNEAVTQFQLAYSTDGSDPVMAKTINVAGRQRMLSQKMMKEACFVRSGFEAAQATASLTETMALFETSLTQLENGDAGAGIAVPPSQDVIDQLQTVRDLWTDYQKGLAMIQSGETVDPAAVAGVAAQSDAILAAMHQAVLYYVDAPGA